MKSNGIWNYALDLVANKLPARILRVREAILRCLIFAVVYLDDASLRDIERLDDLRVLSLESVDSICDLKMSLHAVKALSSNLRNRRLLAFDNFILNIFLQGLRNFFKNWLMLLKAS
jgi:hypothetical protein